MGEPSVSSVEASTGARTSMTGDIRARVVWSISLPIIFAEASETILHLIDTLFLARVGVQELGAIGVADSVQLAFLAVPLALVDAIQILTARRAGQRRPQALGAEFNQGLVLVIGVCLASTVALVLASRLIGSWFVESEAVSGLVHEYLEIAAYGIVFNGASFAYSALLVSLGRTRVLVPATILLAVTNIAFDYVLIFGRFGVPALGMRGAALGSLAAEIATFLFLTVYVWRQFNQRYGLFRIRRLQVRTRRLLTRISAPVAAQRVLEPLRWVAFFLILERVSETALAIATIVYTCYVVFSIPAEGFSETVVSLVSRLVGRNQTHRIGSVLRHTAGGAMIVTLPLLIVAVAVPEWVLAVFNPDANLLAQSSESLRVVAVAMLVGIPAWMWYAAVAGTGDTAAALGIELVVTIVMLGPVYVMAIHLGWPISLVWIAIPLSWLVCLAISYAWVQSGIWRRLEIH